MDPFAVLVDLTNRLDWTLDENETRIAKTALEDLSDEARFHGKPTWTPATAPRMVRKMVLAAAVRYMRNPDGYTTSRAGDETLSWNEQKDGLAGSAHFAPDEIRALRDMAGSSKIFSVPMTVWGKQRPNGDTAGYVPTGGTDKPFPAFADEKQPW